MWESQTNILFRTEVNSTKKQHLENLIDLFSIPSKGVVIILDSDDYEKYPNPIWMNQGLHLNIRMGGIEEMSPEYLLEIMESRKYSHLIWLSKRICDSDLIKFVWVVSHEFQHFRQSIISHELSVANTFLYYVLGDTKLEIDEPRVEITIPSEFDAELSAFKTITELFGATETKKYIRQPHEFRRIGCLLEYDLNKEYDIVGKTIYFLEKYRNQLNNHIKDTTDCRIESFDIDHHINKLKELKSHNIGF